MRREEDFLGLPVRSLQLMLGTLSRRTPELPRLAPDGIFGEATLEAVMRFQRTQGLPVTGRVDGRTWEAIAGAYRRAILDLAPPRPVRVSRDRDLSIRAGQSCPSIFLIQAMFLALAQVLEEVEAAPVNGRHTGASVRNAAWLQRRSGLAETGRMDRDTWNMISRLYELFQARVPAGGVCPPEFPAGRGPSPALERFPWEPRDRSV